MRLQNTACFDLSDSFWKGCSRKPSFRYRDAQQLGGIGRGPGCRCPSPTFITMLQFLRFYLKKAKWGLLGARERLYETLVVVYGRSVEANAATLVWFRTFCGERRGSHEQ